MDDDGLRVVDAPERSRFEARTADGALAGFAAYQLASRLVVFTHTEVDPAFEGQGVGGRLAAGALDDVRRRGLHALPLCPFVRGWIERHPAYQDLVYARPASSVRD